MTPITSASDPLGVLCNNMNRPLTITGAKRIPGSGDRYPFNTSWEYVLTTPSTWYLTDAPGVWYIPAISSSSVESIITDSGTAIPSAGTVVFTGGSTGLTFTASGNTVTLTGDLANIGEGVSKFVVDSQGTQGYTTIQAAITAAALVANAATPQTVWIWPGTYTENITFSDYVSIAAAAFDTVFVTGNATYSPNTDVALVNVHNISFTTPSTGNAFSLAGTGASTINFTQCNFNCTNGTGSGISGSNPNATINQYVCFMNCTGFGGQNYSLNSFLGGNFVITGSNGANSIFTTNGCNFINSQFQESITFNSVIAIFYDCTIISSNFVSFGAALYTFNCIFNTGSTYWVTGTGDINYGNILTGIPIDPAMNQNPSKLQIGPISFDGGNTFLDTLTQGTIHQVLLGTGTSAVSAVSGTGTSGQVLTAQTGAAPIWASSTVFPITPYVVGSAGQAGYQTIQSAIDAANSAGGGQVWIQYGTYTEDLTLYDGIQLSAPSEQSVTIIGTHTPPSSGTLNIDRMTLQSSTDIFSSTDAGTTVIIIEDCTVKATNGYTFNLPNWVSPGAVVGFDIGSQGTNDGWVNNTGGATVFVTNATIGNGSVNTMNTTGFVELYNCSVQCAVDFQTGSSILVDGGTIFENVVTISDDSTGTINNSSFSSGSSSSITMSSSANCTISNCTVNSSNNPAISGSGTGILTLSGITFISNSNIANTLTIATTGGFYPAGNFSTAGQVLTSNGTGNVPTWENASDDLALSVKITTFTSGGTFTADTNLEYAIVECIGGGGGGGGSGGITGAGISIGQSGSSGTYSRGTFSKATIGASQSITIGAGGSGGIAGSGGTGSNGQDGGDTSFGSLLIASGGNGGNGTVFDSTFVSQVGAAGSSSSTGASLTVPGGSGGTGWGSIIGTSAIAISGAGGSSFYAGGSQTTQISTTTNTSSSGPNAVAYGGGASGGIAATTSTNQDGGDGGTAFAGLCIVTEYILI